MFNFAVIFTAICLHWVNCDIDSQTLNVDIPTENINLESDPAGHLKPLGAHRPKEGVVASIDYVPDPKTFFEEYVKPGKPLLMKGQAKKIPAYDLWTDEYLREKFGHLFVQAEKGKKETRTAGVVEMRMKHFLNLYRKKDIYVVQDLHKEMQYDFHLLKCMLCGGFTNSLQTAIMWFSSGGTKSVLHNDGIDNINCIMQGDKDFIMFDKKYQPEIERNDFVLSKGYSKVDVDKVDMYKFPGLRNLPWYLARMEKGDCMFIPKQWYHQVRSYGDTKRNLAINIWFSHLTYFNETDCKERGELPESQQVADFSFLNPDEQTKNELLEHLGSLPEVTVEQAIELWTPFLTEQFQGMPPEDDLENEQTLKTSEQTEENVPGMEEHILSLFEFLDVNKDGVMTREEFINTDVNEMKKEFPELFMSEEGEDDYFDNPDPPSDKDVVKDEL